MDEEKIIRKKLNDELIGIASNGASVLVQFAEGKSGNSVDYTAFCAVPNNEGKLELLTNNENLPNIYAYGTVYGDYGHHRMAMGILSEELEDVPIIFKEIERLGEEYIRANSPRTELDEKRQKYNLKITAVLRDLIRSHPDLRFMQLLHILGLDVETFEEESEKTYDSVMRHVRSLNLNPSTII